MMLDMKTWSTINKVLLGLVLLVPGLLKLLVMGSSAVSGMLGGIVLFSWASGFWAWILIIAEITFGLAILFNYKVSWASFGGALILLIATIFVHIQWAALGDTSWSNVLIHLVVVSNFMILAMHDCKGHKK